MVTNSVRVADVFHAAKGGTATVVLTGGVRTPSDALVGPVADQTIATLHFDLLFLGVHGVSVEAGLSTPNLAEAETNRRLIRSARRVVVVADHTKWGTVALGSFARLDEVDTLVTDGARRTRCARRWPSTCQDWWWRAAATTTATGGEAGMGVFRVERVTALPPEEAWRRITDWRAQAAQVPLTRLASVSPGPARAGTRFTMRTGVGPVAFDDPMAVVRWEPPAEAGGTRGRVPGGEVRPRGGRLGGAHRAGRGDRLQGDVGGGAPAPGRSRWCDPLLDAGARRVFARALRQVLGGR